MTMHHELLKAYRQELQFLREVGAEFGKAHPRLGRALSLDSSTATDPFVERLLEGVAFLTAKTSLRLDNEQARLQKDLFSVLMPDLLCPLPPACMVEFQPLATLKASSRVVLPRGLALRYAVETQQDLQFRTTTPVELAPLKLEILPAAPATVVMKLMQSARQLGEQADLASCRLLRISLTGFAGQAVKNCLPDALEIYFKACDEGALLWHSLTQEAEALLLVSPSGQLKTIHPQALLKPTGWDEDDALLPAECVLPSSLRLLREWIYWPERFAFAELVHLAKSLQDYQEDSIELWWFVKDNPLFPNKWSEDAMRLFCAPAVNLSHLQCEPIALSPMQSDYALKTNQKILPERELIAIESVHHMRPGRGWQQLKPMSDGLNDTFIDGGQYSVRQLPRWGTDPQSSQVKQELEWRISPHLNIQDNHEVLTVNAWTSQKINKQLRPNDAHNWHIEAAVPVMKVRGVGELVQSNAQPALPPLKVLSFRIDQLAQVSPPKSLEMFKEWLEHCYAHAWAKGVESFKVGLTVRRAPHMGVTLHAQGWLVEIGIDEQMAIHPQLSLWEQVLIQTLCKQLYSESFLELQMVSKEKKFPVCRLWR